MAAARPSWEARFFGQAREEVRTALEERAEGKEGEVIRAILRLTRVSGNEWSELLMSTAFARASSSTALRIPLATIVNASSWFDQLLLVTGLPSVGRHWSLANSSSASRPRGG